MEAPGCGWPPLDEPHGRWLGVALVAVGSVGCMLTGWLSGGLLVRGCPSSSRVLLLNIALACLGRSLVAGFPFAGSSAIAGRWLFGDGCCHIFAGFQQLFTVASNISIFLLSLERTLISRHLFGYYDSRKAAMEGNRLFRPLWKLNRWVWAISAQWVLSGIWATLPLFGWGRYGCDQTGFWCAVTWPASDDQASSSHIYAVVTLLMFHVLPLTATWGCAVAAACPFDTRPRTSQTADYKEEICLTKTALLMSIGFLFCQLPLVIQHCLLWARLEIPLGLKLVVPLADELKVSIPTVALMVCGSDLRNTFLAPPILSPRPREESGIQLVQLKGNKG